MGELGKQRQLLAHGGRVPEGMGDEVIEVVGVVSARGGEAERKRNAQL